MRAFRNLPNVYYLPSSTNLNIKQRLFRELDIYFQERGVFGMFGNKNMTFLNNCRTLQTFTLISNAIELPVSARVLSKENKL